MFRRFSTGLYPVQGKFVPVLTHADGCVPQGGREKPPSQIPFREQPLHKSRQRVSNLIDCVFSTERPFGIRGALIDAQKYFLQEVSGDRNRLLILEDISPDILQRLDCATAVLTELQMGCDRYAWS
jgi:hypothetical protein